MNLEQVREIVAMYAPEYLSDVSDHWGRWPKEAMAIAIIDRLAQAQDVYERTENGHSIDLDKADIINSARASLLKNCK